MRKCLHCGEEILDAIKATKKYCAETCRLKAMRVRNADRWNSVRRGSRAQSPMRYLLYRAKHRAKQQGIPFDISEDDVVIPTHCPVLGIELKWNLGIGRKGYHPDSPSVDKIVPSIGYVKGNVRVISARANLLKNNATSQELLLVLRDLLKLGL